MSRPCVRVVLYSTRCTARTRLGICAWSRVEERDGRHGRNSVGSKITKPCAVRPRNVRATSGYRAAASLACAWPMGSAPHPSGDLAPQRNAAQACPLPEARGSYRRLPASPAGKASRQKNIWGARKAKSTRWSQLAALAVNVALRLTSEGVSLGDRASGRGAETQCPRPAGCTRRALCGRPLSRQRHAMPPFEDPEPCP
jgi:hypothetical protein